MAKEYWLQFGAGNPSLTTGLAPTFTVFNSFSGVALTPPGITQPISGYGLYHFTYAASFSIVFLADGATTGLNNQDRYITGSLDPQDNVDQILGSTLSSFGSTSVDPSDVMGYLRRIQELLEGNATYTKSTGLWDMYSRGSSTLLREKTLVNNTSSSSKT